MRLDPDARAHLFRLAGLAPAPRLGAARDQVHPALLQLLDNFPAAAAYVLDPAYEILATNRIAEALLAPFGMTNMLRMMFQHPQARQIFGDWDQVVRRAPPNRPSRTTFHRERYDGCGLRPQPR